MRRREMSFFGKIKQGLGIGTAGIELTVPGTVDKTSGAVTGSLVITAKSDQKVKAVRLRFTETHTSGSGENRKAREYVLGETVIGDGPFDLRKDERREIAFTLPFSLNQSSAQQLADKGGALGALGKVAVFAANEKSEFYVRAMADLEDVALDPTDVKTIRLI